MDRPEGQPGTVTPVSVWAVTLGESGEGELCALLLCIVRSVCCKSLVGEGSVYGDMHLAESSPCLPSESPCSVSWAKGTLATHVCLQLGSSLAGLAAPLCPCRTLLLMSHCK